MSESGNLENLLKRHKIYNEAGEIGKGLRSENTDVRETARRLLRGYHSEKNGIELSTDQPLSEEFYDWIVLGMQAESGRNPYWNAEKESCVSELSSKVLEDNLLSISPVKLEEEHKNYSKHSGALELHMGAYQFNSLCEKYDSGEIGNDVLKKFVSGTIHRDVSKRLDGDEYLTDNDKGLVLRSALSTLNVGEVARNVTGKMAEKKEKELKNYFENVESYSASDYVGENLIHQENVDYAIGKVAELYEGISE